MNISDSLRIISVRRRTRKALKHLEAVERQVKHTIKTLDKMRDPVQWRALNSELGMIYGCTVRGVKLLKEHVGPRNIMEAMDIIHKIADMEKAEMEKTERT